MIRIRVASFLLASWLVADRTIADVVVVANRSSKPVAFRVISSPAQPRDFRLASGDTVSIAMRSTITISCPAAQPADYALEANAAYFFKLAADGSLRLEQVDLGGDEKTASGRDLGPIQDSKIAVIPVKILVDDEEPAVRQSWEARLRQRLQRASEIFESAFRVRFEVVAVETWESTSESGNFDDALRELERTVQAAPARLVIGFTSQFEVTGNDPPPEAVRPPLHSHLLVCERLARFREPERLELLVHSLGHYLGAAHSPESSSVMRTKLGDGQARRSDFRITFDPVNTLLAYLTAEEVRYRNVANFSQLLPETSLRLRQLYTVLDGVLPSDSLAMKNLGLLRIGAAAPSTSKTAPNRTFLQPKLNPAIVADARSILRRMREMALADAANAPRRSGDQLTAYYIREAARGGEGIESERVVRAYLIAVGVGLDDSDLLRNNPLIGEICRSVETTEERAERLRVLGSPTMLGRRDLAQHFVVSAFLTGAFGEDVANAAGIAKELLDARSGSGFSFADLAADRAGMTWAGHLLARKLTLGEVASRFTVTDFMPPISELPEGLNWDAFVLRFGSADDERFRRLRDEIQQRINQLPGYRRQAPARPRGKVISSNFGPDRNLVKNSSAPSSLNLWVAELVRVQRTRSLTTSATRKLSVDKALATVH